MSAGFFSSSKNTLIFASGVVVSAALVASVIETDLEPDRDAVIVLQSPDAAETAEAINERRATRRGRLQAAQQAKPDEDSADRFDEEDLIDDTVGVSTDPIAEFSDSQR